MPRQPEKDIRVLKDRALDASAEGITIADAGQPDQPLIYVNKGFELLTGYAADNVLGTNCRFLQGKDTDPRTVAEIRRAVEDGRECVVEILNYRKDGRPFWNRLSITPIMDDKGTLTHFVGVQSDITARKEAETQTKEYAKQLAQQNEDLKLAQAQLIESEKQAMLGRLLAGLLHELNTPLGALRSAANSMTRILTNSRDFFSREQGGDAEREKLARQLETGTELSGILTECTNRIESVLDGLARFVRIDSAEVNVEDIRDALRTTVALVRAQAGEEVEIETIFPDEPALVKSETARLNQAFLSVVQNALDAIDGGGKIVISLERRDGEVEVRVSDDGRGMSPEQVEKAFDFGFGSREGRVRLKLGLATSRRTVEDAGGSLTLESATGKGTVVRMSLPTVES
jgi:PAS domain S-box-containing protein